MPLDDVVIVYFVAALITGLGTERNAKFFYRRTLLWPLYWLYLVALFLQMAKENLSRER